MMAFLSGIQFSSANDPIVVRFPAVGVRSFIAIGTPCNGPSSSPRRTASSAFFALARASSS